MGVKEVVQDRLVAADDIAAALGLPYPTPEQRAVIEAPLESMLVVAGAGSGKTETMAARVVWLVANGHVSADRVLGLTFTRKAAGELAARIGRRLRALAASGLACTPAVGPDANEVALPVVSTYHAYAGRILADHGPRLGVEPSARLLGEAAAWQLAHEVVSSYEGEMDRVTHAPSTVTRAVLQLTGELGEHLRGVHEVEAYLARLSDRVAGLAPGTTSGRGLPAAVRDLLDVVAAQRQVLPVVAAYERAKRSRNCLDHADQVALAARLAREVPAVGAGERERYDVVLLDEFQDTSEAQLVLLRSLFGGPGAGVGIPVTAVGDPHQSIYGWRGASATTLTRFPREFGRPGRPTPVRPLSVSWRNAETVLEAANALARPLAAAAAVPVAPLVPAPAAPRGRVRVARYLTVAEEAAYVAEVIEQEWYDGHRRPTGRTAAVLCRRRSQFSAVVEALSARGLPVEVVGLGGLLTTPEVRDVVALLAVAEDPTRSDRLVRLLTAPGCRWGVADLDALGAWARSLERARLGRPGVGGEPRQEGAGPGAAQAETAEEGWTPTVGTTGDDEPCLVEVLDRPPPPGWVGPEGEELSDRGRQRLARLAGAVRRLRALRGASLAELVGESERLLGLDVELAARPDRDPELARIHLDAFADAVASYQLGAEAPTMAGLLEWVEAATEQEDALEVPATVVCSDAVQVLTVHAAKGLEWDVVAVPGLVEGAFPGVSPGKTTFRAGTWSGPAPRDKGWCVGLGRLPYDLRGDRDGLPRLDWLGAPDGAELRRRLEAAFATGGERAVAEERRLAYVASTRARHELVLTCSVWTDASTPRVTSRFLEEIRLGGAAQVVHWAPLPDPDAGEETVNPARAVDRVASWPTDPLAHRRGLVAGAADLVAAEAARLPSDRTTAHRHLMAEVARGEAAGSEVDREILLLLRAREKDAARRARGPQVRLPDHVSTSSLVALAQDEDSYALNLRRPLPAPPAVRARAGTAFHAWIETHYRHAAIVDLDEIPGPGDHLLADDAEQRARFLASEWAQRVPCAIELPVEAVVAGTAIRGRIDAVFPDGDGVVIVDWKSGRSLTGARAAAAAVQLGTYRLAYARLTGLDPARVRAAFYDAATGRTSYPELPDEATIAAVLQGSTPGPEAR